MNPGCYKCKYYRIGGEYENSYCKHPSNIEIQQDAECNRTRCLESPSDKNVKRECTFFFRKFDKIKSFFEPTV